MNEKGAVLPSVMVFVLLMSIILLGTNKIFENQMNQLRMTKHYYNVESMLILSKMELKNQYELNQEIENGIVTFSDGTVTIQKKSMDSFTLKGTLKNVFSKQMEVQLKQQPIGNSNDMEAQEDRIAITEN
ncbi:hypothetical protein SAMN05878443_1052 [Carnobacterium alterfunditum]|uniref:Competence protein ComGF n=1 Tax=Carnobacterium alterfunditum TaxID=28230 RepID=A0A1N6G6T5_9LACT|nr:hypothetical protein [Carnobacterium alterfunditum]SIO03171.1 hypothetical protein SAMN05878443_1052 [Carnobacterium alterfunditum]